MDTGVLLEIIFANAALVCAVVAFVLLRRRARGRRSPTAGPAATTAPPAELLVVEVPTDSRSPERDGDGRAAVGPGHRPRSGPAAPESKPESEPEPDPIWRDDDPVELGDLLGGGGQGQVHEIEGDPDHVFKTLARPAKDSSGEWASFVRAENAVRRHLAGADVELVWPEMARMEEGAITGYSMPRIPHGYAVTVGGREREATLAYALPKEGHFRPAVVPDQAQRLALVIAVGRFLDALHRADYVYGDVSWSNILYRLEPRPTVLVFDLDGVRRIGARPALSEQALDTIDWDDLGRPAGWEVGFDSDRYKYALLAYRMLVCVSLSAPLPDQVSIPADLGFSDAQIHRLTALFTRAASGPGARPTVAEWLAILTMGKER